jgi:uncharacterized damage-inducible protein DinB
MNIENSIIQYNEVFNEEPWFGTSVLKSLEQIPVLFWNKKPEKVSHSIAELIYHIIDWRGFVIEKLKGNATFDIELNTEKDWRKGILIHTEEEKKNTLETLVETQNTITKLLATASDLWLSEPTLGKTYTNAYMMRGIMQHDTYHLGQINLIYSQLK